MKVGRKVGVAASVARAAARRHAVRHNGVLNAFLYRYQMVAVRVVVNACANRLAVGHLVKFPHHAAANLRLYVGINGPG